MAIRFLTTARSIPNGSGKNLTAGLVDGRYYGVDRTLASATAYLTDNTASWFNNTNSISFTSNTATITTAITDLRNGSGGASAGVFVAIGKTFVINSGGRFIKATGNQSIYFINCNFLSFSPSFLTHISSVCSTVSVFLGLNCSTRNTEHRNTLRSSS